MFCLKTPHYEPPLDPPLESTPPIHPWGLIVSTQYPAPKLGSQTIEILPWDLKLQNSHSSHGVWKT